MLKSLQSYMYIGQSQRKGLALIFVLILCYAVFKHYYVSWNIGPLADLSVNTVSFEETITPEYSGEKFDINTAGVSELKSIGIDPKVASRLINFRDKIGGFNDWKQVSKVYGLKSEQLATLKQSSFLNSENVSGKFEKKNFGDSKFKTISSNNSKKLMPTAFDPNTASAESLQQMGISSKIVNGIINFRNSGFKYKSAEDLKKIYSMDETTFNAIKSFVQISSSSEQVNSTTKKSFAKRVNMVDINMASVDDLDQLPGIGPGYANKIINWRNKLGGFHSLDQIGATYNLPDSVFQKIKSYIQFNTAPEKLHINLCDEKALSKHFYINAKQAKIIIAYRNNHGPFKNEEDLIKVGALDNQWIKQVSPYLAF